MPMSRYAVYGGTKLHITDDSITSNEIRDSMTQIFPELRNATIIEKRDAHGTELHMVPLSKRRQHQLDIELDIQTRIRMAEQALSIKTGSIEADTITVGWPDTGYLPGDADEKRRSAFDARLAEMRTKYGIPSPYVHDILGKYATRGGYEHLVGKKAKIISENTDLEIYTIEVEGDDTQYVIRMKDIQKR